MANRYKRVLFQAFAISFLLVAGCADVKMNSAEFDRVLEGKMLYKDTGDPYAGLEVLLFRLRKPLFSMQGWEHVSTTTTDSEGNFVFNVSERGPYWVRWNPEGYTQYQEFPVDEFDGRKSVEILHVDREKPVYPWDK